MGEHQNRRFRQNRNQPWNVAPRRLSSAPVGKKMVVLAPWHKGTEPEGLIPLYINPGSAFGAGTMRALRSSSNYGDFVKPGMTTADIGTGSGY